MRPRTALFLGGAFALALTLGGLVRGVVAESRTDASPTGASTAIADRALSGASAGIGPSAIRLLEARAHTSPEDGSLLIELGFAYQLRWRETADASYLPRSEAALRRAMSLGSDPNAILGLGSLALIRHDFRTALAYGRRAERLLPGSYRPYGVIGDALVELGRYEAGFAAYERMISFRPSLASYARIAYARELVGDRRGAVAAMRLALASAAGQPEPTAWAHVEVAKLELALGRVESARRHTVAALRGLPGYPSARIERARIEAAAGDLAAAVRAARTAVQATPTPQSVALLGDLLERVGRPDAARRQRETVAVIDRVLAANGVRVDLESAVYRADNLIRPAETVERARRARANRPSVYGDDALAWALARAGRCEAALLLSERALRLGTEDGLLLFHRGYAEGCTGNSSAMREWYARALAVNPAFSIRWAPVARAALAGH